MLIAAASPDVCWKKILEFLYNLKFLVRGRERHNLFSVMFFFTLNSCKIYNAEKLACPSQMKIDIVAYMYFRLLLGTTPMFPLSLS